MARKIAVDSRPELSMWETSSSLGDSTRHVWLARMVSSMARSAPSSSAASCSRSSSGTRVPLARWESTGPRRDMLPSLGGWSGRYLLPVRRGALGHLLAVLLRGGGQELTGGPVEDDAVVADQVELVELADVVALCHGLRGL